MGLIKDFLFGRKIKIQDAKIGELSARVRKEHPSVACTWSSSFKLLGQKQETTFIMEGNYLGPNKDQLKAVHKIVDTLDNVVADVAKELKNNTAIHLKLGSDWKNSFHLSAVMHYTVNKNELSNSFEVSLDPIKEEGDCITWIWDDGKITEIEVY